MAAKRTESTGGGVNRKRDIGMAAEDRRRTISATRGLLNWTDRMRGGLRRTKSIPIDMNRKYGHLHLFIGLILVTGNFVC